MAEPKPRFRISKRGYDRFAVDDTLDRLTFERETLKNQLETYNKQMAEANEQLISIKTRYQSLLSELSVREKAADDIARLALKEANSVIASAQNNADSIVREALSTAKIVLVEIARISKEAKGIKKEMHDQLEALTKALDNFVIPVIPAISLVSDKDNDQDNAD
ncbi:MAG: cell division protein DivIVA [Erysipelotrichaceae bacterium]|jgi:cell division initiation protein|nr:cell division protein DivIVA [Erysipelotrichaceae bacterium]